MPLRRRQARRPTAEPTAEQDESRPGPSSAAESSSAIPVAQTYASEAEASSSAPQASQWNAINVDSAQGSPAPQPVIEQAPSSSATLASADDGRSSLRGRPSFRLKYQPKSSARRSQAERDAKEAAELARQRQRYAAANRIFYRGRVGRGRGRGRGGFSGGLSGWRHEMEQNFNWTATGVFGGVSKEEALASKGGSVSIRRGGKGSVRGLAGSRASGIDLFGGKGNARSTTNGKESADGQEESSDGRRRTRLGTKKAGTAVGSGKGKEKDVKAEEETFGGEYEGDIDDEGDIDVEYIASKPVLADVEANDYGLNWDLTPVRLLRQQHINRAAGVSIEASSATAAQIRQKAREAGIRASDVAVIASEGSAAPKSRVTKYKGKQKEVEFVADGRKWQGVYSDDDKDEPKIKKEDEDLNEIEMTDAPTIAAADPTTQAADPATEPPAPQAPVPETPVPEVEMPPPDKPARKPGRTASKSKKRAKSLHEFKKPVLQTPEDYAEWKRYKEDMAALAEELKQTDIDKDGDISMADDDGEEPRDRRENLVYLFQLPPCMPNLITPAQSKKLSEAQTREGAEVIEQGAGPGTEPNSAMNFQQQNSTHAESSSSAQVHSHSEQGGIKREGSKDSHLAANIGPRRELNNTVEDDFEGRVGTLTVYESGETSLDWGGVEFELRKGVGELLQEVLVLEPEGQEDRKAYAMSEVSAMFVITPNLDSLLKAED